MNDKSVIVAGETFSSNLGDGIIADSICYLLKKVDAKRNIVTLDISGRLRVSELSNPTTKPISIRGNAYLEPWQQLAKWHLVRKKKCQKTWQPFLQKDSVLLIGGGQLLMDNALNFPLKIQHLVQVATKYDMPVHFFACGVGSTWSGNALHLFKDALQQARSVSVRDTESAIRLNRFIPTLSSINITADPGVWAAEVYGRGEHTNPSSKLVGLGIISPYAMNKRLKTKETINEQELLDFWTKLVHLLQNAGKEVEIFTNGSPEDFAFAVQLHENLSRKSIVCHFAFYPKSPKMLAHTISRYSGVIASRLHANIISFSYGIPTVGLVWDDKVQAFYAETGRQNFCRTILNTNPIDIVNLLETAILQRIDTSLLNSQKEKVMISLKNIFVS